MHSFAAFWEDSITCFTEDAGGKLCGAVALGSVSGLLLLLAHAALGYERCRYQVESGREATTSLYCLLGNSCSTIGAILSRQLHVQVVLAAFSAIMDAISFITLCIPICLCRKSKAGLRMRARRRRQHLYGVCVLFMLTGGFLKVGLSNTEIHKTPTQRRLLQIIMEDNSDILGYVLGILSFVIAYTSRFPALYRTCNKRRLTRAQLFSAVLCSLAGSCYATALLLYDTSNVFIWRTMPWLLSAVLCAMLDLLMIVIHLCKKQNPVVLSPDTVSLLGKSTIAVKERPNEEKNHSTPQIKKKNAEKLTGTDCYLHVKCSSESKSPIQLNLSRTVKKEGEHNKDEECLCSSDTSFDSSVISSDLEWDFEDANVQWCEPAAQLKDDKFPLQEWQSIPLTN
ncbi:transmembrane protein 44 [Periophthalmus magnuspinnatus]|uniref:transmembrane protein 44 n=1 Tax=Periophthalmus magnuspinnatus TaxID=409849 RepID=UPI002437434F|nr:transmembrane protein 44 [Periophthalmus magnuspinnatus]